MESIRDTPIEGANEDRLKRQATFRAITDTCLIDWGKEGQTIAVTGPWGSGKSSCLNVLRKELEKNDAKVVEFNPWLWRGRDDIVQRLLRTIAGETGTGALPGEVRETLVRYADELSEARGEIKAVWRTLKKVWRTACLWARGRKHEDTGRNRNQVEKLKGAVSKELEQWTGKLVVLVDDIDRLEPEPLQDMLMAMRLAAWLPKVVFVLALDRGTVAKTLGKAGFDGHDYLDKIIEREITVPPMMGETKVEFIAKHVEEALNRHEARKGREYEEGILLLLHILEPLLETPRDMKRLAMRVDNAMIQVPKEVREEDLIALECLRLKVPEADQILVEETDALTAWVGTGSREEQEAERAKRRLLGAAKANQRKAMETFINTYLPATNMKASGQGHDSRSTVEHAKGARLPALDTGHDWRGKVERWRQDGRIAERSILQAALGQRTGPELERSNQTQQVLAALGSRRKLAELLEKIPTTDLADVVLGLEYYRESFTNDHAMAAIPVLMEVRVRIGRTPTGLLKPPSERKAIWVVRLLLEAMEGNTRVEITNALVKEIGTLGGQAAFLSLLREQDAAGRSQHPEGECDGLEKEWLERVIQNDEEEFEQMEELFEIAAKAREIAERTGREWTVWDNPRITRRILAGAETVRLSYSNGEMCHHHVLRGELLKKIWGGMPALTTAVEKIRMAGPAPSTEEAEAMELVRDYVAGHDDSQFQEYEKTDIYIAFSTEIHRRLTRLARDGETIEAVCNAALKKGHGDESVGANRGLVRGKPRYRHEHGSKAQINPAQQKMAERTAQELGVSVDDTWRTILAAGLDKLEKEREEEQ